MSELANRLEKYLADRSLPSGYEALTADASTREYFRIEWEGGSAVACVYPEAFEPVDQTYIASTNLFLAGGLPVAEIYDVDGQLGVIVQEDLGDRILRDVFAESEPDSYGRLLGEAISLIARIQTVTGRAFESGALASRLKFDEEKLLWELNFFKMHYFHTFRKKDLPAKTDEGLTAEFTKLSRELESHASVLCHRDFHAANLMIDGRGRMRIIDHQDARIGSPSYDLVSLLLDRITVLPTPEWLAEKRRYFLDVRRTLGLAKIDEGEFASEFRLQTLQRCLKAAGTFSFQAANRGKTYFIPYIKPMFRIVLRAAGNLDRFPVLKDVLEEEINELRDE